MMIIPKTISEDALEKIRDIQFKNGEISVIELAEQRLKEEIRQNELGADNNHDIAYWVAYLDGAGAQLKECKCRFEKVPHILKEYISEVLGGIYNEYSTEENNN